MGLLHSEILCHMLFPRVTFELDFKKHSMLLSCISDTNYL